MTTHDAVMRGLQDLARDLLRPAAGLSASRTTLATRALALADEVRDLGAEHRRLARAHRAVLVNLGAENLDAP